MLRVRRKLRSEFTHYTSGVCVLELIVAIPVAMMFLLGVITFGLILSESSQVLQAANVGAQRGSIHTRATASTLLPFVVSAVDEQLAAANFSPSFTNRQVIVESTTLDSSMASSGANLYSPPDLLTMPGDSIRVTVAVRLEGLSEDFLASYGFSIANGFAYYRVVKKYNGPTI